MQGPERLHLATNGIVLHTVAVGDPKAPLVILLHGFPDFSAGWRSYWDPLAAAGFRVLAPDQRGYNLSAKPEGRAAYRLDVLVDDVLGLIDGAGKEKAILVGHDWGGAVAWWAAHTRPDRVDRAAILCVPHPLAMRAELQRFGEQARKSYYMGFFQLPGIPEALLGRGGGRPFFAQVAAGALPGTFDGREQEYCAAYAQPGALTGMLNWYRAARTPFPLPPEAPAKIPVPVQFYWGKREEFMVERLVGASLDLCERSERIDLDGTHWLPHERPEEILPHLLRFFRS